jgi:hypothetical protein
MRLGMNSSITSTHRICVYSVRRTELRMIGSASLFLLLIFSLLHVRVTRFRCHTLQRQLPCSYLPLRASAWQDPIAAQAYLAVSPVAGFAGQSFDTNSAFFLGEVMGIIYVIHLYLQRNAIKVSIPNQSR